MPEETTLRCDNKPRCTNRGVRYYVTSDQGDAWKVILCSDHKHKLLDVAQLGEATEPTRPSRRVRPASREALRGMLVESSPDGDGA